MRIKGGAVVSRVKPKKEVVSVWFNAKEYENLQELKYCLNQLKDGTAIKQLINIAANLVYDKKIMTIAEIIIENKRKNKRLGIIEFE